MNMSKKSWENILEIVKLAYKFIWQETMDQLYV